MLQIEASLVCDIEIRKRFIQEGLISWGKKNCREFPWRNNRTPYSVLLSELLLRRTTATAVNRVFKDFIHKYPSIQKLSEADKTNLSFFLTKIGYQKRRTEIFDEVAQFVVTNFAGELPRTLEELLRIPHVGKYTANAVLSFGYGMPFALVDSNVERIIRRIFLSFFEKKPNAKIIQQIADILLLSKEHQIYNYAILDFGAAICRYGVPKCSICFLQSVCDYFKEGNPKR